MVGTAGEMVAGRSLTIGWLARDTELALPERHLGLVQAIELDDLESRIARAAADWAR